MRSRRRFLQISFVALLASAARAVWSKAEPPDGPPTSISTSEPMPVPALAAPQTPRAARQALLPLLLSHQAPVVPAIPAALQADQQIYIPLLQTSAPPLIGAPLLGSA